MSRMTLNRKISKIGFPIESILQEITTEVINTINNVYVVLKNQKNLFNITPLQDKNGNPVYIPSPTLFISQLIHIIGRVIRADTEHRPLIQSPVQEREYLILVDSITQSYRIVQIYGAKTSIIMNASKTWGKYHTEDAVKKIQAEKTFQLYSIIDNAFLSFNDVVGQCYTILRLLQSDKEVVHRDATIKRQTKTPIPKAPEKKKEEKEGRKEYD